MNATEHKLIVPITLQLLEGKKQEKNSALFSVSKTFLCQTKVYILEDETKILKESTRFNFFQCIYLATKNIAIQYLVSYGCNLKIIELK